MVTNQNITADQIATVRALAVEDGNASLVRRCDQATDSKSAPGLVNKARAFVVAAYNARGL